MFTIKIWEGQNGTFKNTKDAIEYIIKNNFEKEITLYDTNSDVAYKKTDEIYAIIKEYNKGKPLNEQILPSNPFGFRGIVGCLGVKAYSITLGTYKRNHECIALFSGYNGSVLDTSTEDAKIMPGLKAMASLRIIGEMYRDI